MADFDNCIRQFIQKQYSMRGRPDIECLSLNSAASTFTCLTLAPVMRLGGVLHGITAGAKARDAGDYSEPGGLSAEHNRQENGWSPKFCPRWGEPNCSLNSCEVLCTWNVSSLSLWQSDYPFYFLERSPWQQNKNEHWVELESDGDAWTKKPAAIIVVPEKEEINIWIEAA